MRSQEDVAAMQCPVCRVPLAMSDRQGIEIDYCPQCRGVWLDRGELDKIVERTVSEAAPAPAPRAAEPQRQSAPWGGDDRGSQGYGRGDYGHSDHRGYSKSHKRKSFLSELFD